VNDAASTRTSTAARVTIANRAGALHTVAVDRPLLDSLLDQGVDLPYGCRYGGCITCAAKLIDGRVDQREQVALNDRQINDGYVVLCVARPLSDCTLEVGVESHDALYPNPFQSIAPFQSDAPLQSDAPWTPPPEEA